MKYLISALVATCVMASSAMAGGDPEAGEAKAAACIACHGEGGKSTLPMNPKLAGQYASYLEHAMRSYRDGGRKNPIMGSQVAALSDADIQDLAAYFAAQESQMAVVPKP